MMTLKRSGHVHTLYGESARRTVAGWETGCPVGCPIGFPGGYTVCCTATRTAARTATCTQEEKKKGDWCTVLDHEKWVHNRLHKRRQNWSR